MWAAFFFNALVNKTLRRTLSRTHTHKHTHTLTVTKRQVSFQQFGSQCKNSRADLTSALWSMPK